jgi:hypothetical protein
MKFLKSTLFVLLLVIGANVKAQMILIEPNDTFTYQSNLTTDFGDITTVYGHAINNTSSIDTMYWRVLSFGSSAPNWELSVCDPVQCYSLNFGPYETHRYTAKPDTLNILDWGVSPHCVAGTCSIEVLMWLASDSTNSARKAYFTAEFNGGCVGIEEFTAENVKLYPIPVKDRLTIDGLGELNSGTIKVYDVIGNLVASRQILAGENKATINLTNAPAGMYFVSIESEGQKMLTRRVQKN